VDLASSNNRTLASSFKFRLRSLKTGGDGYMAADGYLTPGFSKTVSYWTGDSQPIQYSGELWELDPVEVRIRAVPPQTAAQVDPVEAAQIAAAGVDVAELQQWLKARNLALLVVRNATQRDSSDAQQPFNLRVPGGVTGLAPDCDPDKGCKVWDVDHLQVFEARYVRGRDYEFKGQSNFVPSNGRRVLPRPLTEFGPVSSVDAKVVNPPAKDGTPKGSVALESDGSIAAFIPARRALTWQLIDSTHPGNPAKGSDGIVRERYWLTYQPGEIRTCPTCHGVNKTDQKGLTATTQPGAALSKLLQHWKDNYKP
jgi:hypothetical protein